MSAHYTLILSLALDPKTTLEKVDVLRYVFNDGTAPPSSLPSHKFFETFDPQYRFHKSHQNFQPGAWQAAFWMETPDGSPPYAGVNLCLPGNKLEAIVQDLFPLVEWLATMSASEGPVGIVIAEDLRNDEPMVLFVRNRRVYIGMSNPRDAKAVDDGSPYWHEE
jgi:hypothetical protein